MDRLRHETESSDPRERASRFFGLMRERGELRQRLRVAFDAAVEAERVRKGGSTHELLALLRERRQKPSETRKAAMEAETPEKNRVRARLLEIDREIKAIIADPDAHEAIHEGRRALVSASREEKRVLSEWRDLHGVLDELDADDFSILKRRTISAQGRKALEDNQAMREAVESRIRELRDAPETAVPARLAELSELRRQLRDHKFAMTESRRELASEIRRLWAKGEAVLLTGPTGTGKTELFAYLTRMLYGKPLSRLIRATERTGPPEIFGKMGLRATQEGGTETVFQPGVYTDAIDAGMPFIIDEFNMLDTKIRFGLKELYNRGPGDEVVVQEDSGRPHKIRDGFVFGATANIKGAQSKERFELDPAESRVFASRRVGYLSKEELYDDILATLMSDKEELRLSRADASETLKRLLEAVELTQQAYVGAQTQFYAEGGGAKKKHAVLEKAVIDPGRVLKVLSGWPVDDAKGVPFRDFLEREIAHIIRTEDYPEADRRLLLQIFVTKGFFRGWDAKAIGVPGMDEAKLRAWGWSDAKPPAAATETLSREQVAALDPFELRKLRASDAADEFLKEGKEELARALATLRGLDLTKFPKSVQDILKELETELPFDARELRRSFDAFYRSHDLPELADALPADIRLTPEQLDLLKAKQKEGYTRMILVPAGIERHLAKLKTNLTDGLGKTDNGQPVETFLSDNLSPSFPNHIQTVPPREGAYLILTNPNKPLLDGSKNKKADDLIPELAAAGLQGLTLADFLIEERLHFDATGNHLVDWKNNDWTWLLSSRDAASRVLVAFWLPDGRQVRVFSNLSGDFNPILGVRPSVVLELMA